MCSVLVPWRPSASKNWAFADDRSIVTRQPNAAKKLQQAIDYTNAFDTDAEMVENAEHAKCRAQPNSNPSNTWASGPCPKTQTSPSPREVAGKNWKH